MGSNHPDGTPAEGAHGAPTGVEAGLREGTQPDRTSAPSLPSRDANDAGSPKAASPTPKRGATSSVKDVAQDVEERLSKKVKLAHSVEILVQQMG